MLILSSQHVNFPSKFPLKSRDVRLRLFPTPLHKTAPSVSLIGIKRFVSAKLLSACTASKDRVSACESLRMMESVKINRMYEIQPSPSHCST